MSKFIRAIAAGAVLTASIAGCSGGGKSGGGTYTVGVAMIGQIEPVTQLYAGFKEGLRKGGVDPGKVHFIEKNANGDQSVVSLISQQLVARKPDLILSLGTPVTLSLAKQTKTIPIVFGAMTDPKGAGVVQSLDRPGGNLTGSSDYLDPAVLLNLLKDTVPNARRIGIIANPSEQNSASQVTAIKNEAAKRGLTINVAPAANSSEVAPAARSLVGRVDAVLNTQDNTTGEAFDTAARTFFDAKIPVIGVTGSRVKDGTILASVGVDYTGIGVPTGEMAAKLLTGGAKPADTPVVFANGGTGQGLQYSVNNALAEHFAVRLPTSLTAKATAYDTSPLVKR